MLRRMMSELEELESGGMDEKITALENRVEHLWYRPGGPGYDGAQDSFEAARGLLTLANDKVKTP